jgi:hypothetical protein
MHEDLCSILSFRKKEKEPVGVLYSQPFVPTDSTSIDSTNHGLKNSEKKEIPSILFTIPKQYNMATIYMAFTS